jgi:error-prone DNA polymerase
MTLPEHVVHDYATTSFSLKAHPVSFIREQLNNLHVVSTASLANAKDGDLVKVSGLVLVRQRPGTASGICFITIEDETGTANLVVFQKLFDQYRKEIIQSRLLMVEGKLQREGEVIHVVVKRCYNFSRLLQRLTNTREDNLSLKPSRADETTSPFLKEKEIVQVKIFPEGRNFR